MVSHITLIPILQVNIVGSLGSEGNNFRLLYASVSMMFTKKTFSLVSHLDHSSGQ